MIIAQTHGAVKILRHGTYDGFCLDVVVPMASSISLRSSGEMRGCAAGLSKINQNQPMDHNNPIAPTHNDSINESV